MGDNVYGLVDGVPTGMTKDERITELEAENAKLKDDIRVMVEKAAAKHLPAYREQGDKMLALEAQLELCKPLLRSYQTTIAGSRGMCDEDERELWDRIDAALIQESE